jgi:hypothetical protein
MISYVAARSRLSAPDESQSFDTSATLCAAPLAAARNTGTRTDVSAKLVTLALSEQREIPFAPDHIDRIGNHRRVEWLASAKHGDTVFLNKFRP